MNAKQLIARVRAIEVTPIQGQPPRQREVSINVVRSGMGVVVNDHPANPFAHTGHSIGLIEARELGEGMMAGERTMISSREGVVLRFVAGRLGDERKPGAWVFPDEGHALGAALVRAADTRA